MVLTEDEIEAPEHQPEPVEVGMQAIPDRLGDLDGLVDQFVPVAAAPVQRAIGRGDPGGEDLPSDRGRGLAQFLLKQVSRHRHRVVSEKLATAADIFAQAIKDAAA
ncbi:hypothetical protein [Sinosporangium album]|uniref:hypothetical protein n=1 Tax=Sinosporangium album TaxID=504805 RepID=UPI00115FBAB6|nr:hypothetical protein [Sinosporangium album]